MGLTTNTFTMERRKGSITESALKRTQEHCRKRGTHTTQTTTIEAEPALRPRLPPLLTQDSAMSLWSAASLSLSLSSAAESAYTSFAILWNSPPTSFLRLNSRASCVSRYVNSARPLTFAASRGAIRSSPVAPPLVPSSDSTDAAASTNPDQDRVPLSPSGRKAARTSECRNTPSGKRDSGSRAGSSGTSGSKTCCGRTS